LALFVQYLRWRPQLETTDWSGFQTLATCIAIDETLESLYNAVHGSQETFGIEPVVEVTCTDARANDVRADGVEGDSLFG
jgi:hypothetical protein